MTKFRKVLLDNGNDLEVAEKYDEPEDYRVYVFKHGEYRLEKVVEIARSETTHRLKTADGAHHIVMVKNPDNPLLAIRLGIKRWSF